MKKTADNNCLSEALGICRGISSVIGSGGKTSLLRRLSLELSQEHTVILSTSTHILPFEHCPLFLTNNSRAEEIEKALSESESHILTVASRSENGKLTAPDIDFSTLAKIADYVLVEADGSRRLPLKAHAEWEPRIADGSTQSIAVVGASGFFHKIKETVHRPELMLSKIKNEFPNLSMDSLVLPKHIAYLIKAEACSDKIFVNLRATSVEDSEKIVSELRSLVNIPVFAARLPLSISY